MSIIDTIDAFDKLEFHDQRSFAIASALIAKSIQQYKDNPSGKFDSLKLLFEIDSPEIILEQKAIEREWLDNDKKIIPFTTILDSCLSQSLSNRSNISQQPLYIPFRPDKPIDYEPIQWQTDDSSIPTRFIVRPPSSSRILQPRNEPTNDNNTNTVVLDDNDDQHYVDAVGDEENELPKITIKKKGKKKKQQQPKVNIITTNNDISVQLNTSSNRTSSAGHKFPQKLSSKWSSGKRISCVGKTSAIRKFARSSHDRQNRADSRTLFHNKPSVTINAARFSQEQYEQLARAAEAEERKQEARKRKVEKLHEQAKKREEVLNRAKQIQQDKDQKNQLRISDNQSKNTTMNQNKKIQNNTFNNSMNDSTTTTTTYVKPTTQPYKPVLLDTTSNKILNQNKIIKNPANGFKKPTTTTTTNAEYTFVVDKNNPLRNDITLPSSSMIQQNSQFKADWTISGIVHDELELDNTITDTTHHSDDGDYGIEDIRSDQDSDNDDEDEARIPNWAKERLFQTFWKTQGHWYLSRRTLKLTRRTFGHYPTIKDQVQIWLRDLKSSKPLSETFTDATYLDQTQAYF
ncbi:unnamed protein product [Rotaria sordida]|uniref:Uncharacterized protein n=1 Tax=Rotaria sordida TaxID=392033 RepID=A0A818KDK9_9BILA|nr:unnamed protein product [Rotaria sordida]CAF3555794.1 unnamed protein product [Rotaria sordida]